MKSVLRVVRRNHDLQLCLLGFFCAIGTVVYGCSIDTSEYSVERNPIETATTPASMADWFNTNLGWSPDDIRYGEFHAHSNYSLDAVFCGANDPTDAYDFARNDTLLDFVGLSDHAEYVNSRALPFLHRRRGLSAWQSQIELATDANDEASADPFLVFAAWEYTNTIGTVDGDDSDDCGSLAGYGHKNVILRDLDPAALPEARSGYCPGDEVEAPDAWALYDTLDAYRPSCPDGCVGSALTIVHTPAMVGDLANPQNTQNHSTDWDSLDADFTRHVEIISKWGNGEGHEPIAAGCELYDDDSDRPLDHADGDVDEALSIRTTLYDRWVVQGDPRFIIGFVGGTDTHSGTPGNDIEGQCGMNFRGGVTGIVAADLDRDTLWNELWHQHTIAVSTGSRISLIFAAESDGQVIAMGDQGGHDGTVHLRALASDEVSELHLIIDGCRRSVISGNVLDEVVELDAGRHYIYVRAIEDRGAGDIRQAWSSPIYLGEAEIL